MTTADVTEHFSLNHLPFYSGFYEIRAYTKYMLNFGENAIYSRVIPVFEKPKKDNDYSQQRMTRNISQYSGARQNTEKPPKIAMRFFPEGGRLIDGVPARVAFELTDRNGMPVDGTGTVIDETTAAVVDSLFTIHEGRGFFSITPQEQGKYTAYIRVHGDNKQHKFQIPEIQPSGVGLRVDNVTNPDSILIAISPGKDLKSGMGGIAVSSQGALWSYSFGNFSSPKVIRLSTEGMPSGVSVITLFGQDGRILAERMIFVNNGGFGKLSAMFDKPSPGPHDKVTLEIEAVDPEGNPEQFLPISISVTDAENAVDYQGGLLSDLLLMSEIKGYVRNPKQYFSDSLDANRLNLDLLMMVHGWRSYSWEEMAGINPIDTKYRPEQAIDLDGKVVSFVRGIPKANTDISVLISQSEPADSVRQTFTDLISTDSCGEFTISYDLTGKWNMVTTVSEKGKNKDHRLILNRLFSPAPRRYEPGELVIERFTAPALKPDSIQANADSISEELEAEEMIEHLDDSLSVKSTRLGEVVVSAKRNEIYLSRSKSVEYYDVQEELGDLADKGVVVSNDLFDVLKAINPNFMRIFTASGEKLKYKNRKPLFAINYKRSYDADSLNYTFLYPESVKSIYISEDPVTMLKYADPITHTMFDIDVTYGCVVLIETFDEPRGPAGKGTRLQTIEGYTVPAEFQNIENLEDIDEPDLRRTLYWNPELITDAQGKAAIQFINNASARNLRLNINGISPAGTIFTY